MEMLLEVGRKRTSFEKRKKNLVEKGFPPDHVSAFGEGLLEVFSDSHASEQV